MNNKVKGTLFERKICDILKKKGYWVHFITPDYSGAQPFDIIAVKDGVALAADCKTCDAETFGINRLEDNQVMAFQKWLDCGNQDPVLFVEHSENIYVIPYCELLGLKKVKLNEGYCWIKNQN